MSGTNNNFGEFIRNLREEKKLPLRKVASQLDIDPSTLGKIERNQRSPNSFLIKKLSEIFNVDEKELKIKYLSDKISYDIFEENLGTEVLKVAEEKFKQLKKENK
jgi:transcriptional regulator with XRE-family HTH domain